MEGDELMRNMILIGYMGSGKSTIGKRLARSMNYEFVDTDQWIEQQQQCKIREIFDQQGEAYFRSLETQLLIQLSSRKKPMVISTGGGMPCQEGNIELLQKLGTVIYLKASPEILVQRLSGDKSRPLLRGSNLNDKVKQMLAIRDPLYKLAAHEVIVTDGLTLEKTVELIQNKERRDIR